MFGLLFWHPVCICFCIHVLGFCFGILFWIPVLDYHDMHSCFCISLFDIPFLIPTLHFFVRTLVFCILCYVSGFLFPDSCCRDSCFRSLFSQRATARCARCRALPRAARALRARCRALRARCARCRTCMQFRSECTEILVACAT